MSRSFSVGNSYAKKSTVSGTSTVTESQSYEQSRPYSDNFGTLVVSFVIALDSFSFSDQNANNTPKPKFNQAFLVNIPEPGTVLLLLLGFAPLFFGRKAFRSAWRTLFANRDAQRC